MAKKLKIKLPKKVAGVKIPKALRKGSFAKFLNTGAGQAVMAEAVLAALAVFAASKTTKGRSVGHSIAESGADAREHMTNAFREAVKRFRELTHLDEAVVEEKTERFASKSKGKSKGKGKKKSQSRIPSATTH